VLFGIVSLVIASILIWRLPPALDIAGKSLPFLPAVVGAGQIALAFLALRGNRADRFPLPGEVSPVRWVFYGAGVCLFVAAAYGFVVSLFSPRLLGLEAPAPRLAAEVYVASAFIVASIFNLASKQNLPGRPNDFRWLVFYAAPYCLLQTAIFSLLLVYAMPHPNGVAPFPAATVAIAGIPYSVLIFRLAKTYVREPSAREED
jgi:hypothetical protein